MGNLNGCWKPSVNFDYLIAGYIGVSELEAVQIPADEERHNNKQRV